MEKEKLTKDEGKIKKLFYSSCCWCGIIMMFISIRPTRQPFAFMFQLHFFKKFIKTSSVPLHVGFVVDILLSPFYIVLLLLAQGLFSSSTLALVCMFFAFHTLSLEREEELLIDFLQVLLSRRGLRQLSFQQDSSFHLLMLQGGLEQSPPSSTNDRSAFHESITNFKSVDKKTWWWKFLKPWWVQKSGKVHKRRKGKKNQCSAPENNTF